MGQNNITLHLPARISDRSLQVRRINDKLSEAHSFIEQSLIIFRETGYLRNQLMALGSLSLVYEAGVEWTEVEM